MTSANRPQFTLIDLFSGAGGMTLGFTEAFGNAFKPIWANDIDTYAVATYNAVPPLLAAKMGECVYSLLCSRELAHSEAYTLTYNRTLQQASLLPSF